MPLPRFLARWVGQDAYNKRIADGLDDAWERADPRPIELSKLRAVVFSDHHRGQGDGADDFRRCEDAYCAALGWYLEAGYELWLLGDVEELWENRPLQVLERYENVLALEKEFGKRLWRFYGNHDLAWERKENVDSFLAKHLPETKVREAVKIVITDNGEPLGTLFVTHGHQGTIDSGNLLVVPVSRFVVRFGWGTLQRARGFASTSPATDAVLRSKHDCAMAAWADKHPERLVLVTGHTHRPVFPGTKPPDRKAVAAAAEENYNKARESGVDVHRARAAYELARVRVLRDEPYQPPELERPSYFNTGCCSFGDGDITGLEFSDGKVKLVRWLEDGGGAFAKDLEKARDLGEVLRGVSGTPPALPAPP